MTALQYWFDFSHTSTLISHRCMYVPFLLNPICIILSKLKPSLFLKPLKKNLNVNLTTFSNENT